MKRKSLRWFLPCILLMIAAPALAAPPGWVQVTPTNDSMFVFGTVTVTVNHIPVSQSTSILGAFVPGLATPDTVVGITNFAGNPGEYSMPIYGNDTTTPSKDGANAGDNITFQLYYAPEDQILSSYTFTATDELGNPLSAVQYVSFGFDNVTINFDMDLRPVWDNLSVFSAKSVNEGENLQFTAHATDPDGTVVTHVANNLPAFCTYNTTSGLVNCNPTFTDNGVYNVTFRASSAGLFALPDNAAVAITVNNVNRAPVFGTITPSDNVTGNQGATLTKAFTYSDPDSDTIVFDTVAALPSFCSVSGTGNARTITCTPTLPAHQGTYAVTARITDNGTPSPLNATHSFNVIVTNRAPAISGLNASAYDNNSSTPVVTTLSVTDVDGNAIVSAVCTMTPSKSWFSFDNSSLTAPRITIQGPMPAGDVGSYPINCSAADDGTPPQPQTASANLIVSSDPIWSPVPVTPQAGSENTPFSFTVHAFDAFSGTIVYSATGLPSFCSLNTASGLVSCTPDYSSSGTSTPVFRAQVTSGSNAGKFAGPDNAAVTITVANVNRAPVFGTITPAGEISGNVGSTLTKTFPYSDPDGDAIVFDNVAPLPSFCSVSGTGSSRTITCTPTLPSHQGTYPVTARITDDGTPSPLNATHSFNVTVTNRVPVVSVAAATPVDIMAGTVNIPVTFTDLDNNAIPVKSCSMAGSPSWFSFDAGTNTISVSTAAITFANDIDTVSGQKSYNFTCNATDDGTPAMSAVPVPGTVTLFKNPQLPGAGTVTPTSRSVTFTGGSPTKASVPAVSGDEIYVFAVNPRPGTAAPGQKFDRKLVGHAFITSTGLSVDAYGDDTSSTGAIEGLVNGEEVLFVLFSQSDSKVYTAYRVDGTGWSKVWDDTVAAQTVALDFIDGQRIPLRTGAWNLFGYGVMKGYLVSGMPTPAAPQLSGLPAWTGVDNLAMTEPLQSIAGKYDRVIGNDGSGAKLWNPSAPRFSSLTYLAPGYGYWVKMKASATQRVAWLTVPGTPATGTESLAVAAGWTLLAYPGSRVYVESGYDVTGDLLPVGTPSPTALAGMGNFLSGFSGTYDRATSFDANGAKLWNPALPSVSTMKYMAPGYGFWFHATAGGTLFYPEGAP